MVYYIATNKQIPTINFDKTNPGINIQKFDEKYIKKNLERVERKYKNSLNTQYHKTHNALKKTFAGKYIYYLGSSSLCGCNFRYMTPQGKYKNGKIIYPKSSQIRKLRQNLGKLKNNIKKKDMIQLFDYLNRISKIINFIEIYGCWDGEHHLKPIFKTKLNFKDVDSDTFIFIEGEYLKILFQ